MSHHDISTPYTWQWAICIYTYWCTYMAHLHGIFVSSLQVLQTELETSRTLASLDISNGTCGICKLRSPYWLLVWNIFPSIGNNHSNWLSYFSEGLKPPTSLGFVKPVNMGSWSWSWSSTKGMDTHGLHGRNWLVVRPEMIPSGYD